MYGSVKDAVSGCMSGSVKDAVSGCIADAMSVLVSIACLVVIILVHNAGLVMDTWTTSRSI